MRFEGRCVGLDVGVKGYLAVGVRVGVGGVEDLAVGVGVGVGV